jgi:hypothetical protein
VSGLAAPLPAGRRLTWSRRCRGRIVQGRKRRLTRAAIEPPLQLGDAGVQPPVRLDQLTDPHQQGDRPLPVAVEDRLRLGPLHTPEFGAWKRVPSGEVNAYQNPRFTGVLGADDGTRTHDLLHGKQTL